MVFLSNVEIIQKISTTFCVYIHNGLRMCVFSNKAFFFLYISYSSFYIIFLLKQRILNFYYIMT
jgi:hypothetical protein